jgi:hypothetical protein
MRWTWVAVGGGLLVAATCATAIALPTARHPHSVNVARDGRDQAELDVVSGATTIAIGSARLGGELMRLSTPANSGVTPDVVLGRTTQVFLDQDGGSGPAALQILLNSQVTWRLVFAGGASQISVDLGAGRFGGADFAAGASLITMRLADPHGTVPIVLAGGASQVSVSIPDSVSARLRLDGGAATATIGRTPTPASRAARCSRCRVGPARPGVMTSRRLQASPRSPSPARQAGVGHLESAICHEHLNGSCRFARGMSAGMC